MGATDESNVVSRILGNINDLADLIKLYASSTSNNNNNLITKYIEDNIGNYIHLLVNYLNKVEENPNLLISCPLNLAKIFLAELKKDYKNLTNWFVDQLSDAVTIDFFLDDEIRSYCVNSMRNYIGCFVFFDPKDVYKTNDIITWLMLGPQYNNEKEYMCILNSFDKGNLTALTLQGYGMSVLNANEIHPIYLDYIREYLRNPKKHLHYEIEEIIPGISNSRIRPEIKAIWLEIFTKGFTLKELVDMYCKHINIQPIMKEYLSKESDTNALNIVERYGPCFALLKSIFGESKYDLVIKNLSKLLRDSDYEKNNPNCALLKLVKFIYESVTHRHLLNEPSFIKACQDCEQYDILAVFKGDKK